jgi:hypothetical protein
MSAYIAMHEVFMRGFLILGGLLIAYLLACLGNAAWEALTRK